MGINDYQLSGGIDSRSEEILATGLATTPEEIAASLEALENRRYQSDLEWFLGKLVIQLLQQRISLESTAAGAVSYTEDVRNAINVIQSRLDDLDAEEQSDLNEIQSALNTLQTTVNNLSTTVQGKASTTDVNDALDLKADKTDITDPAWGQIEGSLANQTDLTNALSGKASISDLAAVDTRTRNLESSVADKASKTEVNAKANTTDVNAALDLKADTSWTNVMLATKASKTEVDAKANTADVETAIGQLGRVINSKADASEVESLAAAKADKPRAYTVSVPTSGWSGSSHPYTCNLTVSGVTASDDFNAKLKLATNLTADQVTQQRKNFSYIWNGNTAANKITLYATEKPTVAMSIEFRQVI